MDSASCHLLENLYRTLDRAFAAAARRDGDDPQALERFVRKLDDFNNELGDALRSSHAQGEEFHTTLRQLERRLETIMADAYSRKASNAEFDPYARCSPADQQSSS